MIRRCYISGPYRGIDSTDIIGSAREPVRLLDRAMTELLYI